MVIYVIEFDGVDHEYTLNIASVTGARYVGFGYTMRNVLWLSCGTSKTTEASPYTTITIGNKSTVRVKEIYLYTPIIS